VIPQKKENLPGRLFILLKEKDLWLLRNVSPNKRETSLVRGTRGRRTLLERKEGEEEGDSGVKRLKTTKIRSPSGGGGGRGRRYSENAKER